MVRGQKPTKRAAIVFRNPCRRQGRDFPIYKTGSSIFLGGNIGDLSDIYWTYSVFSFKKTDQSNSENITDSVVRGKEIMVLTM